MGWTTSSGPGNRAVAEAFYAGRRLKRGNCHTNGSTYYLFDNAIAHRIQEEDIPKAIAHNLLGVGRPRRLLEYSWAGWIKNTTQAHLHALGVFAYRSDGNTYLNKAKVDASQWYTPDELILLRRNQENQAEQAELIKQQARAARQGRQFVQTTMELFPA